MASVLSVANFAFAVSATQAARQIVLDIDNRLQPDRDADQAIRDARRRACFWRDAPMGGAGRVGDRRLGIAEVGSDRDHPRVVDDAPRCLLAALDLERHDAAAGLLLSHRQLVLRMRRQARIEYPRDVGLRLQPTGQLQ